MFDMCRQCIVIINVLQKILKNDKLFKYYNYITVFKLKKKPQVFLIK